ncbi:MAG: tol-pal system-associated acyl-CoA thioesterase [Halieaceae bacterium]
MVTKVWWAERMEFSLPIRVYIEDTDAGGIVYYVNYLKFIERARTEFMRSLGFDKTVIFSENLMFVVRDVNMQYLLPACLDEELTATAKVRNLGGSFMEIDQRIMREDVCVCTGRVKIVCVDRISLKPRRMPAMMRDTVKSIMADEIEGER